jgi:ATP-dependent helicase HrpB
LDANTEIVKLPVDDVLEDVRAALRGGRAVVLEAPPGAGKTTRVPPALLDVVRGQIVVLEPRRLAARLAARRIAEELGGSVGEVVGYQVRFEDVTSAATRIRFVTEGLLLRQMISDPTLRGVGAVILDEFHERHLQGDLALAMARKIPDLKLAVMSATLDAGPIAAFLGAPIVRAEGKLYDVTVEYVDGGDSRLEAQVAAAVRRLRDLDGDVLVFLPGAAEIGRAAAACGAPGVAGDREIVTLHGDMNAAAQDRAVRPGPRRKVILSTNVAESSVTIEGVVAVVDSGLARIASHSPWTGLPSLRLAKISQASAAQRAGRAGRLRPGVCVRLYTKHDHDTRPRHDVPEVRRADLAEAALLLGERAPDWFEPPEPSAWQAARALLDRLGAAALRDEMLRYPLHPRLARMMIEAERRGVTGEASWIAAALGERTSPDGRPASSGRSDLDSLASERTPIIERARAQIAGLAKRGPRAKDPDAAIALAVLAGFPDRVARRRRPKEPELVLSEGGSADLSPSSVVRDAELMVAVDVTERRTGTNRRVEVRRACAIDTTDLIELFPERVVEEREAIWNPDGERVEIAERLRYDALILDETRRPPGAQPQDAAIAAKILLAHATIDRTGVDRLLARIEHAGLPAPDLDAALVELCAGATRVADLRDRSLRQILARGLDLRAAPEHVTVGTRRVEIQYERGKPPWIETRLQDFFGTVRGPRVGDRPLVLHLLAPNQRAVQVTTDLEGFWDRHYPAIRKELMRKYPKHSWPEDPRVAAPPQPKRR